VVALGGRGSSVTPVSQFYFQQAYMNVVMGKWKKIVDGYGQMVLGYFGKTPRPADPEVIKIAAQQLKKEPFTGDPLDVIEPGVPAATKILEDNNLPVTEENIFIIASCEGKGLDFLKGNAPLSVYYKEEPKKEEVTQVTPAQTASAPNTPQNLIVNVNGKDYSVLVRPNDGSVVQVTPPATASKPSGAPAPASKPAAAASSGGGESVTAPMPGTVFKLLVKEGDKVEAGQAVIILEAMKMENELQAEKGGTVTQVSVAEGDKVDEGAVLIVIE